MLTYVRFRLDLAGGADDGGQILAADLAGLHLGNAAAGVLHRRDDHDDQNDDHDCDDDELLVHTVSIYGVARANVSRLASERLPSMGDNSC